MLSGKDREHENGVPKQSVGPDLRPCPFRKIHDIFP